MMKNGEESQVKKQKRNVSSYVKGDQPSAKLTASKKQHEEPVPLRVEHKEPVPLCCLPLCCPCVVGIIEEVDLFIEAQQTDA